MHLYIIAALLAGSTMGYRIATASAFYAWLPDIMLGILASASLVSIYYIIGVILSNNRIKSSAANEFGQVIGTALIIAILLWILSLFNSASFSLVSLLSKTTVHSICQQLKNANMDFISTNRSNVLNYFLCYSLINHAGNHAGGTDITANLDYGLVSAYIILANMTNQSLTNLNAVYIFESYTGLLGNVNFRPFVAFCEPTPACLLVNPYVAAPFDEGVKIIETFNVFAGYGIFRGVIFPVVGQSTITVYMFIIQMILVLLFLYGWPYLLAGGIILRSTFLTRRTGGMLLAIAVTGLLIYPLLFIFEYVTLSNAPSPIGLYPSNQSGAPQLYQIPESMQLKGLNTQNQTPISYGTPSFNFFVFPRADYILNYNGCWPIRGSMLDETLSIFGSYLIPGLSVIYTELSLIGSTFNNYFPLFGIIQCTPNKVIRALIALENLYGWIAVTGTILPLINILISISSVRGLSSLFGGDTNLLGIGKLV